jgi:hypothetical protein
MHRAHTQLMVRHVVAAISLLCLFILIACSSPRHRQNFRDLAQAERIEISLNREGPLPPITDRSKIENTAAYSPREGDARARQHQPDRHLSERRADGIARVDEAFR